MDRINLHSPRVLGLLQPKREMLEKPSELSIDGVAAVSQLQTPKRGETVSQHSVKAFSAFTPTHDTHQSTMTSTPVTSLFTTPKSETTFWSTGDLTPDTPSRKMIPERTILSDRLSGTSPFCLTPERQPLDFMSPDRNRNQDSGRRGRPRADMVNNLIIEGAKSGNPIKCKICQRDFPREKSLQAHLRTHTGERPYTCDYPNCTRAFVQSGQLKTHQRLHAGEKPFKCPVDHCTNRYTHANRFCPDHPGVKPKRTTEIILQPVISASEDQEAVYAWLEKYRRDREEKTPGKLENNEEEQVVTAPESGNKLKTKRGLASEMEEAYGQENIPSPPRPSVSRSEILRSTLTAHQSFNQALMRAASQKRDSEPVSSVVTTSSTPGFRPYLDTVTTTPLSPVKSLRRSFEESSPMRGIRKTLGEITPSKNCKVDNAANLDFDLPFSFDLAGLTALPGSCDRLQPLPSTPLPAEKCFSPAKQSSPPTLGSPAIKLKKRFQERFLEEKQQEDDLARPISWTEEDAIVTSRSDMTPITPVRQRNNSPSTFLVAAALMELHDSPTRIPHHTDDLPLNLTKK